MNPNILIHMWTLIKKKKIPCGFKKKQQQKVYPQEKKATAPSL